MDAHARLCAVAVLGTLVLLMSAQRSFVGGGVGRGAALAGLVLPHVVAQMCSHMLAGARHVAQRRSVRLGMSPQHLVKLFEKRAEIKVWRRLLLLLLLFLVG